MKNPTFRLPESNAIFTASSPKKTSLLAAIVARRGKVPFPSSKPALSVAAGGARVS